MRFADDPKLRIYFILDLCLRVQNNFNKEKPSKIKLSRDKFNVAYLGLKKKNKILQIEENRGIIISCICIKT